jgi:hypothetical protein
MLKRRSDPAREVIAGRDVGNYRYDEKGMMDFQHPLFYYAPIIALPTGMKEDFCKSYCQDMAM